MYRKKEKETLDVDLPRAGSVHVFPSPTVGYTNTSTILECLYMKRNCDSCKYR